MRTSKPSVPSPWARACAPAWLSLVLLALPGCALQPPSTPADSAWQAELERWPASDALLLGEQHDAPEHQRWEADSVRWLAERGRLAALVIEMAEAGTGTDGLPPDANAAQVYAALRWNEAAWPWERYRAVIMAAVAAGVPVRGGNLPRSRMRAAMQDEALDGHLPPAALALQRNAIEEGHCGLLPADRVMPMVRIQLARDASMAQAVQQARQDGRTVLLAAGWGHVRRDLGVPTWLPANFNAKVAIAQAGQARAAIESEANYIHPTPALAPRDHCAELRARPPGRLPAAK
ncbi:ChaN family lipoprotein [Diaphorobacter limosus]|uniref:ChaN family lipoprotein n=1 Tax=Diaphorobacter limosus TaxID=3036128 RepID=A0ABZ0J070_9BURK|nr:ChaN family lipoprotein [Diaphorobacter sp. Y-1]WOO30932.1 ChaN family lipoprotein [Diaphorobacter sp. Y-1]